MFTKKEGPMRNKNTELMEKIISFVNESYEGKGIIPSYREIASKFSVSVGCVCKYLKTMAENNLISLNKGTRGIMTKKMQLSLDTIVNVPVVGSVACGSPILAEENIEKYIPIPKTLVGNGNFFILVAKGDSMINANISDGDLVIIKQQDTAEIGQIVVALIDNEATLKRFYIDKKSNRIRLHPENDDMKDMYFKDIKIQGVAVKVIKDLA